MDKKIKNAVIIITTVGVICLIIPITAYIVNFHNYPISDKVENWNHFGGFFGGVTNTIISLFSLIILGFITYQISKFSAKENKKNNLLVRKLDAYNEISAFLPRLSYSLPTLIRKTKVTFQNLDKNKDFENEDYKKGVQSIIEEMDVFMLYHFELNHFETRFGHLFQYDFEQPEFKLLKDKSQYLRIFFQEIMTEIESSSAAFKDYPDQEMIEFLAILHSFLDRLKLELK